jgi:hypothetical protein
MAEEIEKGQKSRREFVKTAAQVAVAAPTVAILLNGNAKALAAENPYRGNTPGPGDDFTGAISDDAGADDPISTTTGDDFIP